MASYILLVFEGEKTENLIFNNMNQYYLNDSEEVIIGVYCTNIYDLYQEINDDEYLDIFIFLKEKPENIELSPISREEVSQIFLFFDYDGHDNRASDEKVTKMLTLFCNETESGMLYLSYPMVEALKHIKKNTSFKNITAESHRRYKSLVPNSSDRKYWNFRAYDQLTWNILLSEHCKKLNYIVNGDFKLPKQYISQIEVFEKQKEKYINPTNHVAVLSAFPIFLFYYYGHTVFSICEMSEG